MVFWPVSCGGNTEATVMSVAGLISDFQNSTSTLSVHEQRFDL